MKDTNTPTMDTPEMSRMSIFLSLDSSFLMESLDMVRLGPSVLGVGVGFGGLVGDVGDEGDDDDNDVVDVTVVSFLPPSPS
mmetsp:Transcript_22838/g.34086  ORF Transcript_22838/g.34086 Transcript_22838/m.34086 type:complete len:81 (+) Transcript_22838:1468-1710(+)